MRQSPVSNIRRISRRESDLNSLRQERQANALPWSLSPFIEHKSGVVVPEDEDEKELQPGELRVKAPEEVPWIDLLLEIAMTTAFASLTDGTPILQWDNALSYVCYFVFVWWIWVAQVAYNMRYRQADWFHKIMVFAQLIVFSALAAFTNNFDITVGLSAGDDPDQALADALFAQAGTDDKNSISATHFRDGRLPILNARGLSMVMGISRLLLLVQYAAVFFHARGLPRQSVMAHMAPLLLSSLCYFTAFALLGVMGNGEDGPSPLVESAKLVLWYTPLLIEIISHFVALHLEGFVGYNTESVYARSGTVFLIILGADLDKITSGFQKIVGNAGLGLNGIPIFISAAVIFIGYFSLYFGTPGSNRELGNARAVAWFFSQFFFLAALIVMLQGIATSVSFSNLYDALTKTQEALSPVFTWQHNNMQSNITASNFALTNSLFKNLGVSFADIVDTLNQQTAFAIEQNNTNDIIMNGELQIEMIVYYNILHVLDADPDDNSLLSAKLNNFVYADITNTTALSLANFQDILSSIVTDRGSSALWFYPAAGGTILGLVIMSLIKGLPRDKFEWGVLSSRACVGISVSALGFLSIGSSAPVFDEQGVQTSSPIWGLALGRSHLLLIIMAIAMAALIITENLFAYAANRSYYTFEHINFLDGPQRRKTRRQAEAAAHRPHRYERTASDMDIDTMPLTPYSYSDEKESIGGYHDPYDPHHSSL